MSRFWKLKRTEQCAKCPWRVDVNPEEIPNGYSLEKHGKLKCTIAPSGALEQVVDYANHKPLHVMACHENHEAHCLGWLMHQLGPGNNLRLRIALLDCTNLREVVLHGDQHDHFEETLPVMKKPKEKAQELSPATGLFDAWKELFTLGRSRTLTPKERETLRHLSEQVKQQLDQDPEKKPVQKPTKKAAQK